MFTYYKKLNLSIFSYLKVIGGVCYRNFEANLFSEIAFLAVTG